MDSNGGEFCLPVFWNTYSSGTKELCKMNCDTSEEHGAFTIAVSAFLTDYLCLFLSPERLHVFDEMGLMCNII